jgi:hypothetical protein
MIGHCGSSRPSGAASLLRQLDDAGAAEVHLSSPSPTYTRLQTISPGLLMPLSVPPPRRKYIAAGARSLRAAQPPEVRRRGASRR